MIHVHNSKKTCEILLDKINSGDVIISNHSVKGFLADLITLHAEVDRLQAQVFSLRDQVSFNQRSGW